MDHCSRMRTKQRRRTTRTSGGASCARTQPTLRMLLSCFFFSCCDHLEAWLAEERRSLVQIALFKQRPLQAENNSGEQRAHAAELRPKELRESVKLN